jgi:hypothetical protein
MKKNISTRMGLFVWEIPVGKYSFLRTKGENDSGYLSQQLPIADNNVSATRPRQYLVYHFQ